MTCIRICLELHNLSERCATTYRNKGQHLAGSDVTGGFGVPAFQMIKMAVASIDVNSSSTELFILIIINNVEIIMKYEISERKYDD